MHSRFNSEPPETGHLRNASPDLRKRFFAVQMSGVTLPLNETLVREFRVTAAIDMDDLCGSVLQPVGRGS